MSIKRFKDPFFPNRPVQDPDYFEGRSGQVEEIINAFYQTMQGNPRHFIITGDRGIGKSSLLVQTEKIGKGDNTLAQKFNIENGVDKFDFVCCWVDAVDKQTVENLAEILLKNLQSTFNRFFGGLKFEIDLGGFVQIANKDKEEKSIADTVSIFCEQLRNAHEKIAKKGQHGIILFIDELDKMQVDTGIATFFKLVTEKLAREGLNNILFACSGITGSIQKLEDEHASIFRTFRDIPLPRFSKEESDEILVTGFTTVGFTFDKEVLEAVFALSGGFPEPIHILGSEILSVSEDDHICMKDFEKARKKVITEVRKNKLGDLLKKAGYGKYQLILEAIALEKSTNVSLDVISKHLQQDANQFSTNIGTLLDKGILVKIERGVYSFGDPLVKEYIKEFGVIKNEKIDGEEE